MPGRGAAEDSTATALLPRFLSKADQRLVGILCGLSKGLRSMLMISRLVVGRLEGTRLKEEEGTEDAGSREPR